MSLSIIVAVAENGVIGRNGQLPWHLSADLRRFKKLTMDHAIIMGRRTWESLGRALPGRLSIVVSRQEGYDPGIDSVLAASSLPASIELAKSNSNSGEAFVIGGAALYEEALSLADKIYITRVLAEVEGDTVFPEVDWSRWQLAESEPHSADDKNDFPFCFELHTAQ